MSKSLVNITINKILNMIKEQKLKPNDKLPTVDELASAFSVGRSTIREALKVLSAQNIIVIKQGAGTFVSEKEGISRDPLGLEYISDDINVIFDMVTLRLIFEPEMASMAAQFATRKDTQDIKYYCEEVEQLIEQGEDYHKADAGFHIAIAKASGNGVIHKITQVIHSSIKKNIFMTDNILCKDTVIFHRRITNCIENGDINGARYAMINHLDAQRQFLIENYKYQLNRRKI